MKICWMILSLFLGLAGCGKSDGGSSAKKETENPPQSTALQWGELSCQKTKTCSNPLLNPSVEEWTYFLTTVLTESQESLSSAITAEEGFFNCGSQFYVLTRQEFFNENDLNVTELATFAQWVVELSTCQPKLNVQEKLNQYLQNYLKENLP